ncbi:MAG TPA: PEP-CTERM sorting domain-containing protein [Tepidisphaeraceae bacterium]|nr:PEP-CTERM sorting domain-containing protein [Tepidisphaeraceae bacterium]
MRKAKWSLALVTAAAAASFGPSAHGATIYEPFDYDSGVSLTSGLGAGDGFAAGQTWGGGAGAAYTITAGGLSLGSLSTSGRAVSGSTTAGITAGRQVGVALTGDVFASYLFNIAARPTGSVGNFAEVRVHTSQAGAGSASGVHFRMEADQHNGGATPKPGISYEGINDTAATVGSSTPATGTTYIYLAKFTNVGETLGAVNTASATMWILTADQFDHFRAGGLTEGELNGAPLGTGATDVFDRTSDGSVAAGTFSLNTSNYVQLATLGTGGNPTSITYDELRFGVTLDDVTPVPEPAGLASLAAVAVAGLLRRRRAR